MNSGPRPRITFGIIVLNGEPFTRYCLRSLYPFAHEIIVVEGGHSDTRSVCTPDGHSVDGTLESLHRFKREEDPDNKVQIITREGFWPRKDELGRDRTPQSRAYAERATGDYLWQVDIDEFYRPSDMEKIIQMLADDPSISAVSFKTFTFWGRPDYVADGWILRRGADEFHRLFKWGPGYRYVTHEPPTVVNEKSEDLRDIHWVRGKSLAARGISMYHYALLFPWQVRQKVKVYEHEKLRDTPEIVEWANRELFCSGQSVPDPQQLSLPELAPTIQRRTPAGCAHNDGRRFVGQGQGRGASSWRCGKIAPYLVVSLWGAGIENPEPPFPILGLALAQDQKHPGKDRRIVS